MSRHGDRRGQIDDFRDSFETINWLYLIFKCVIKTKTHFEWLLWHWSSLGQLNLEPTQPNGLMGCKVPTDLVKISVKEAMHMDFYYNIRYIHFLSCVARSSAPVVLTYDMEYSGFSTKAQTHCFRHYPTLAREDQGFRVWEKFVFRMLEFTDTPTNLANQVKVGHALDHSRSVQSCRPERAHQNNAKSWRSSTTDRRLLRHFWENKVAVLAF